MLWQVMSGGALRFHRCNVLDRIMQFGISWETVRWLVMNLVTQRDLKIFVTTSNWVCQWTRANLHSWTTAKKTNGWIHYFDITPLFRRIKSDNKFRFYWKFLQHCYWLIFDFFSVQSKFIVEFASSKWRCDIKII